MRRIIFLWVAVSVLVSPAWMLKASPRGNLEVQALRAQQKRESNAYKLNERNVKQSLRGRQVSRAAREQQMHQLQRQKRAMKERHRDQLQELKDRQRLMRDNTRH